MKPPTTIRHGFSLLWLAAVLTAPAAPLPPLPGTQPLTLTGDIASNLVAGVDCFLERKLAEAETNRAAFFNRDFAGPERDTKLREYRGQLAAMLGMSDPIKEFKALDIIQIRDESGPLAEGRNFTVHAVRWPAFGDVYGEGLWLRPKQPAAAFVVALPDAAQTSEQLAGLAEGIPAESQFARRLAESGCEVVIPALVDRNLGPHKGRAKMTAREFAHRSAFILGRTMTGYELEKINALLNWRRQQFPRQSIGIFGYGEGGRLALFSAALNEQIKTVCVSGYFTGNRKPWEEPIDRNVFGLARQFGDAELLALSASANGIIEAAQGPVAEFSGQGGGAPARLQSPELSAVKREVTRAEAFARTGSATLVVSGDGQGPFGSAAALTQFLKHLHEDRTLTSLDAPPRKLGDLPDPAVRQARMLHELDRHNQWLLTESPYVRAEFMKKLDTSSLEKYAASVELYRKIFREEIIGQCDDSLLPFNARSRPIYDQEKWTGHEVVLDVYPDVIAYGILLLPKDLKPGEKRPVVVCQHGLEGRPQETIVGNNPAYHDFAAKLAERGFITFAPQNLYIFRDRFRVLQRKANPLGKTLFSIITPQHQQILSWLKTQPFVDEKRIAFYGLSYGGKTAMRVPALLPDYCLSICSADFNEWVWKNASTRSPYSYAWMGEYEIFEWNLGQTFNYAEMAALIAPRPFMVERGHFDGVAPDETVAYEYAKVRHLYAARLKIPDRTAIEWFPGPHTINGQGTFEFLHRHLNWPHP